MSDPAERMSLVRDALIRENAKMPAVDHNGRPTAGPDLQEQIKAALDAGDLATVLKLIREQQGTAP